MKKQILALMFSTILCSVSPVLAMEDVELESTGIPVSPVIAMEDVELESTGAPVRFIKNTNGDLEVTTDDNADASYQAISKRFPVIPQQVINVDYDVEISQGVMSFGFLNTNRNGWYNPELVLEKGHYRGSFARLVPGGETETSLVLRNYHLGTPGQTIFTLNKLQMKIIEKFVVFPPDSLILRDEKDLGSNDPQLLAELQRLAGEYLKNRNGVSVSLFDPSQSKCLPRCMWDIEKKLYADNPETLQSLRDANSKGRLEELEYFFYTSVAFSDSKGNPISIGRIQ